MTAPPIWHVEARLIESFAVTAATTGTQGSKGDKGDKGDQGIQGAPGTPQPGAGTPDNTVAVSVGALNQYVDPGTNVHGPGKVTASNGYLSTPGTNNNYAAAAAACSITSDIDVRWFGLAALPWASGAFKTIINVQGAFRLRNQSSNGKVQIWASGDNGTTSVVGGIGTAAMPATNPLGWRATWRASDGQVVIYALDPAGTVTTADGKKWTAIGNPATAVVAGGLTPGAKAVSVGALASNGTEAFQSQTTRIEIRSGLDGALVVGTDFAGHDQADKVFTDATGKAWQLYGTAAIQHRTFTVTKDGVTVQAVSTGDLTLKTTGPTLLRQSPISRKYKPEDFGNVGASNEATRKAIQDAIDYADSKGGGTIEFGSNTYTVGPNAALADPYNPTQPYAAILTKNNIWFEGAGTPNSCIQLAAGANCHLFAPSGKLNGAGQQDHTDNVVWAGLRLDGNGLNQDGTHTHDNLHIQQHPNLRCEDVRTENADGDGYLSSALGEYYGPPATDPGVTIVRPVWLQQVSAYNNAGWGFFMSATNRNTHYQSLHAEGNGSPQARIAGKTIAKNLSLAGHLDLTVDNFVQVNVNLTAGMTPANVRDAINTALAGTAVAALTPSGKLMITSAVVGGASRVYVMATSTVPLADLGLTTSPINGDLNYRAGANQCGGVYFDHSQCHADGVTAQGNYGDGMFIHNVNLCHYSNLQSANNTGLGIYVEALVTSHGNGWTAGMNCVDLGAASYRQARASAEVYFSNVAPGYGQSRFTTVASICAPGLATSLGPSNDNRRADWAVYVEDGVTLTADGDAFNPGGLNLRYVSYGDGGLVGNLRRPGGP